MKMLNSAPFQCFLFLDNCSTTHGVGDIVNIKPKVLLLYFYEVEILFSLLNIILGENNGLKYNDSLGDHYCSSVWKLIYLGKSVLVVLAQGPHISHSCFHAVAFPLMYHWGSLTGPPQLGKMTDRVQCPVLVAHFQSQRDKFIHSIWSWALSLFTFLNIERKLDLMILLIISVMLPIMFHLDLKSLCPISNIFK